MSGIAAALKHIQAQITLSEKEAARTPDSTRLLAVSKTFGADAVREAYAFGQRAFGENYVQEAVAKITATRDLTNLEWHLIGPLQSNKSRAVAEHFAWVQTVDRASIAERLSHQRPDTMPPLNVLIQVDISGEATKSGCLPSEALALAQYVTTLPKLSLRGFMGIAGLGLHEMQTRAQYHRLKGLYDEALSRGLAIDTLSMGMSADLAIAIAEGATLVRVGTAIFGSRQSKIHP